jgi:hypothetical protein
VTQTTEEFVNAIRQAAEEQSAELFSARIALAQGNRWEDRALTAMKYLQMNGLDGSKQVLKREASNAS